MPGYKHAAARRARDATTRSVCRRRRRSPPSSGSTRGSSTRCRSSARPGIEYRRPGEVPSAQVPRRAGEADRRRRLAHLRAYRIGGGRRRAAERQGRRPHAHVRLRRHRHPHAADGQDRTWRARSRCRRSSTSTPRTCVGGRLPKGTVPEALFWDTADPVSLPAHRSAPRLRLRDLRRRGPQDRAGDRHRRVLSRARSGRARRCCPALEITHRWSGQVVETNDGLPFIGETSPKQFAATGYAGNGMTFGTLAGMMAHDCATGRRESLAASCSIRAARRSAAARGTTSRRTSTTRTT